MSTPRASTKRVNEMLDTAKRMVAVHTPVSLKNAATAVKRRYDAVDATYVDPARRKVISKFTSDQAATEFYNDVGYGLMAGAIVAGVGFAAWNALEFVKYFLYSESYASQHRDQDWKDDKVLQKMAYTVVAGGAAGGLYGAVATKSKLAAANAAATDEPVADERLVRAPK